MWLNDFISLFIPNMCYTCENRLVKHEHVICNFCLSEIPLSSEEYDKELIISKFSLYPEIRKVYSLLKYIKHGKSQRLIHGLKYHERPDIGRFLGQMLAHKIRKTGIHFDIIVPVPLHFRKKLKRGYNQSDEIAIGLSKSLNVDFDPKVLKRQFYKKSLTIRSKIDRIKDTQQLYVINDDTNVKGKDVLIVDDVLTTGSTLIECYEALKAQEPNSVSFAVLAANQ